VSDWKPDQLRNCFKIHSRRREHVFFTNGICIYCNGL